MPRSFHSNSSSDYMDTSRHWRPESAAGLGRHDRQGEEEIHLASIDEKKHLWWRRAVINLLFMLSWFCFAIVLSLYNKWMFSGDKYGFPFPLFVTSLHMWVQFILAASVRSLWPSTFRPTSGPSVSDYGKKAVPAAVSTAFDIGFSNLSLQFITLSLYTMVKSSTLIFVLLFAFLFQLEAFSIRLVLVVLLIFVGVLLTVVAETEVVLSGVILVLVASASSGLRWSLTQLLLKSPKMGMNNPAATLFWLAPSMGITLAITSIVIEGWRKVFTSPFFASDQLLQTIPYLLFPGFLAFCMVLSEYYIIQRTGVVPMSIAGIFKEVATLSLSAWIFGDRLNPVNIGGIVVTFFGIVLFTYHKYRKSLDSNIPIDAHGNPIPIPEGDEERGSRVLLPQDEHINEQDPLILSGDNAPYPPATHAPGDIRDADSPAEVPWDQAKRGLSSSKSIRVSGEELARVSLETEREWRAQGQGSK